MYHHLTIHHCLFSISEKQLAYFKTIASLNKINETFDHIGVLSDEDKLTTVLQVWCVLNEDKFELLFIPEKMMPYTSNYYILNLIRTNKKLKSFIKIKPDSPNLSYILAYYLTIATLKWCDELMAEYNVSPYLGSIEQPDKYYLFLEKRLEETENHEFYIFQKKWANLIATDYKSRYRFNRYIDEAIEMTNNHLLNAQNLTVSMITDHIN